jgi:hypothetical protein
MDPSTPLYQLLAPLTFNDGSEVPSELHEALKDELFVALGGYTVGGTVEGAYRMDDGTKQVDRLLLIRVVVSEGQESELYAIVEKYCELFQQESMYVEKTAGTVRFVRPRKS